MSEERNEQSLNPKEIHIETEDPDNNSKLEILSDEYSRYLNFKDLQEHEVNNMWPFTPFNRTNCFRCAKS